LITLVFGLAVFGGPASPAAGSHEVGSPQNFSSLRAPARSRRENDKWLFGMLSAGVGNALLDFQPWSQLLAAILATIVLIPLFNADLQRHLSLE
jgi:hypothetical protein